MKRHTVTPSAIEEKNTIEKKKISFENPDIQEVELLLNEYVRDMDMIDREIAYFVKFQLENGRNIDYSRCGSGIGLIKTQENFTECLTKLASSFDKGLWEDMLLHDILPKNPSMSRNLARFFDVLHSSDIFNEKIESMYSRYFSHLTVEDVKAGKARGAELRYLQGERKLQNSLKQHVLEFLKKEFQEHYGSVDITENVAYTNLLERNKKLEMELEEAKAQVKKPLMQLLTSWKRK